MSKVVSRRCSPPCPIKVGKRGSALLRPPHAAVGGKELGLGEGGGTAQSVEGVERKVETKEEEQKRLKGQRPVRGVWEEGESFKSEELCATFSARRRAVDAVDGGGEEGHREKIQFTGIHHTAIIVDSLERSLAFYQGILGMEASTHPSRPDNNLPFRGAFLRIGHEAMHLMELDNPDPTNLSLRPEHGGRDRHFCVGVASVDAVVAELEKAGHPYTASKSGRKAVFFRDPDSNTMECLELEEVGGVAEWRQGGEK